MSAMDFPSPKLHTNQPLWSVSDMEGLKTACAGYSAFPARQVDVAAEYPFGRWLCKPGTQGMSVADGVYASRRDDKEVAVKRMPALGLKSPLFFEAEKTRTARIKKAANVFREASILAEVDHPNSVRVLDFFFGSDSYGVTGNTASNFYLVMTFAPGKPLFDHLEKAPASAGAQVKFEALPEPTRPY
eukprot:NODE_6201_length_646_cov_13.010050_g5272_i0.p1 GENE.NODE_6201_length_646_cov_13.010050_g5272_i0~~NODE_6201_length_646_cov_13.010050_g5272_i0.p1  ORF type:complete len:208 (+),score=49.60 NODE_6201_length_646_cov_13.010050_g5272_i0:64-624(+)